MAKTAVFEQTGNFIKKLTPIQKILIGSVITIVFAGLILLLAKTGSNVEMGVLFSSLDENEASKIVTKLKEKNIKYELQDNGSTILVDKKNLYDNRLAIAAEGLPESGILGYEIFDRTNLGMSEFVQKVNYRRALEGELARTIGSLEEVKKVRVHIVMPEKALFEKDQNATTASVTLHLKQGRGLVKKDVEGIQNLIASSVEGMQPGSVTIIDNRGKVLSTPPLDKTSIAGLTASQYEQQINVEQYLSNKVQTLLDGVLGNGNSEVRVNAQLDFTQIEKTITDFDPERQVVRSEQAINENSQSVDSLSYPSVNSAKNQSNQISNYEISKSVEKIVQEVGNIKRLSVSVMINGTTKVVDKNGKKALEYIPRNNEEMQKLNDAVKNAVGFDPSRNDQISVLNVPFDNSILEEDIKQIQPEVLWWQNPENIKLFVLIFAILLTVFIMYRVLHARQIKEKIRLAMSLPEHVILEEVEEPMEPEEELEEIEIGDDELMLLPGELPEQLLLEGEKEIKDISSYAEEEEEFDKGIITQRVKSKLEETRPTDLSEETLMKLEIKEKVQEYVDEQTNDALRLVRIFLAQEFEEKGIKF